MPGYGLEMKKAGLKTEDRHPGERRDPTNSDLIGWSAVGDLCTPCHYA
jgi:hypothetical protein